MQSDDQDAVGLDRSYPDDPLLAADRGMFWEWYQHEWEVRTRFGRLKLLAFVGMFSPFIALFAVLDKLENTWPATYKEEIDDDSE